MRSYGIKARLQEAVDPGPEPSTKVLSPASRATSVGRDFRPALSTADPQKRVPPIPENNLFFFNTFVVACFHILYYCFMFLFEILPYFQAFKLGGNGFSGFGVNVNHIEPSPSIKKLV